MNVTFRTDASKQIGTGHVMRCLTLANALRDRGANCRFVCRLHPGNMFDRIRKEGFDGIALPSEDLPRGNFEIKQPETAHAAWLDSDWQTDAHQTIQALGQSRSDWLIIDHYALDKNWELALRPYCGKIMVIDDLADRDHECDLLLDQNLFADLIHRYSERVPVHCVKLLGPEYALLQPQYGEFQPRTPPRLGPIKNILIFFSGADNHNLTARTISAFLALERHDITLDVVINPASSFSSEIYELAKTHVNINLHEILPSLATLMLKADLAIGAGGATSWERCCLGLPSLVISLAENQRGIAAELDRLGLIRWLGHHDVVNESIILAALKNVLNEKSIEDWSKRCMKMVDGQGTRRLAGIISLNSRTQFKTRLARLDDEALIRRWTNDLSVGQNTLNPKGNTPDSRRIWFYNHLRDSESCRFFIIETQEGLPVGNVRFIRIGKVWDIHYGLEAFARDRKLELLLLQIAIQSFRGLMDGELIFGRVQPEILDPLIIFENVSFPLKPMNTLSITICSDAGSWINESIPQLVLGWLALGHRCVWVHSADQMTGGDLCFFLSYGQIVDRATLKKFRNNLVVHASDLPKGRGWSPTSWMILEGENRIPVTLLEAIDKVDSGVIYAQEWVDLNKTDLAEKWRSRLAEATIRLTVDFVSGFPESLLAGRPQKGAPTYYSRRGPKDSELNVNQTINEQFDLFRIVDNAHYPAYFSIYGKEFVLKIFERGS